MILGIFAAVGAARAWETLNRIDFKPFNCTPCMSFWLAIFYYLCLWQFTGAHPIVLANAFVAYLLAQLIFLYEKSLY